MVYYGSRHRPVPKIRIAQIENHTVLANSILLQMREEIQKSPVLFLGVESENQVQAEFWRQFLDLNQEPGLKYDVVVADQALKFADLINPNEKTSTYEQSNLFIQGVENALAAGKRIAILVPITYSAQFVPNNLVNLYKEQTGKQPLSLSIADFPRHREEEKKMTFPCVVEGVDKSGVGPFGCLMAQSARANYRQRFEIGKYVGLVEEIGPMDYLVLYTVEK